MNFYNNREKDIRVSKARYELMANWFHKVYSGEINDSILVICTTERSISQNIQQFMLRISQKQPTESFYLLEKFEKFQVVERITDKNLILVANNGIDFESLQQTKRTLLLVDDSILSINGLLEEGFNRLYSDINLYSVAQIIEENAHCLYYIQQRDPIEIVYQDIDTIKNHLYFILNLNRICRYRNLDSIFLRNKKFDIVNDLNCLEKNGVLTSRLAIVIYKATCLNATATDTEIGTFYGKELGDKAKNYSNKHFNMSSVKAYKLKKYNAREEAVRVEIANNLFILTQLDHHTISQATELSTQKVLKLKDTFITANTSYSL